MTQAGTSSSSQAPGKASGLPTKSKSHSLRNALIGLLIVAALGVGTWRLFFAGSDKPKYVTQKLTRGELVQVVSATGTLQPRVLSPVGSQVSGIVWKLHADWNDPVKKGQTLVELDPALFQASVKREEANVSAALAQVIRTRADATNARLIANRARALSEQKYISVAERDTALAQEQSTQAAQSAAEAGVKLAQAALDRARLDLKNSVVLSPVDGVVIARNVELGQAVVASFQAPNLFTIAEDLRKMQVLANVDEADIGFLQTGAIAEFTVDAYRGRRFNAKVAQVRNAAQTVQNVVTYVVVLDVDNHDLLLKPGMTANVRVEVARRDNALLLPNAALRFKPRLEREPGSKSREKRWGDGERKGGTGDGEHKGSETAARPDGGSESPPDGGSGEPRKRWRNRDGGGGEGSPRGTRGMVYTVGANGPEPNPIRIGITDGVNTEVISGLTDSQEVITDTQKPSGGAPAARQQGGGGPGGGGMRRGGF